MLPCVLFSTQFEKQEEPYRRCCRFARHVVLVVWRPLSVYCPLYSAVSLSVSHQIKA